MNNMVRPPRAPLGALNSLRGTTVPVTGADAVLGNFHEGGKVVKSGAYELEKGEEVIPAKETDAKEGRNSEYRRIYLGRKKKSAGDRKK